MRKNISYFIFFFVPTFLTIILMTAYVSFIKSFLQNQFSIQIETVILYAIILCSLVAIIFLVAMIFIELLNRKHNKHLENIIFKDSLTKFSNWSKFELDAEYVLKKSGRKNFALINFDINKFKIINDMYGRSEGDKILTYIADAVGKKINPNEIFARSSADNFIILIEFKNHEEIIQRIKNIADETGKLNHTVMLSFGIYIIEDKSLNINLINDRAKIAKNKTKGRHDIFYSFYKEDIRANIIKEKEIEDQMENALKNNEFEVYMQPKFNIVKNKIVGAEALIRWEKDGKIILPGEFMPVFEKNGFVTKIDEYVFEKTCHTIKDWINRNIAPVTVSVNITRLDMHDDSFIDNLYRIVKKFDIPIKYIEVEITETTVMNFESINLFLDVVNKIKGFGFALSMDDFGSGYSSLNLLCDIPVDTLKLDKKFLNKNTNLERGETIITDIISMAKHLNIKIVAEGVETQKQVNFLKTAGCQVIQGYFYSKPLPIKEFEKKLIADGGNEN